VPNRDRDARAVSAGTGRFSSADSIPRRAPSTASRAHLLQERLIEPSLEPGSTAHGTCVIEALGTRVNTALT
jgi:hypothetical protein